MTKQSKQETVIGIFNDSQQAVQAIRQLVQAGFRREEISVFAQDSSATDDLAEATGALAGNDLADLGVSSTDAEVYQQWLNTGATLVALPAGSQGYNRVLTILRQAGAITGEDESASTETSSQTMGQSAQVGAGETLRVPVREETLSANKQRRQAGQVEIQKHVTEEQVSLPVQLSHEEVSVTRHAVDRPLQPGEEVLQEGEVIRVPISEETVDVQKQARVTGEVEIRKQNVTEQRTVSDTVRREQVDVNTVGEVEATGANQSDPGGTQYGQQ